MTTIPRDAVGKICRYPTCYGLDVPGTVLSTTGPSSPDGSSVAGLRLAMRWR